MNDLYEASAPPRIRTPAAFAAALYGRTAREDLGKYEPRELAALADLAWQHLCAPRSPGTHSLRLVEPDDKGDNLAAITVIEVVNDDMPFLLDSTLAELSARNAELRLVAHPILAVERDAGGSLTGFYPDGAAIGPGVRSESFIHIHILRIADPERRQQLIEALERVYAGVRLAVGDWQPMRQKVLDAAAGLRAAPAALPADEAAEAALFLEWLATDHFLFMGLAEIRLAEVAARAARAPAVAGLGILDNPSGPAFPQDRSLAGVTPELLEFLQRPAALLIAKAGAQSIIHRRTPLDYMAVKLFGADGRLGGVATLVGLFTSSVYNGSPRTIPYIRRKAEQMLAAAHLDPASHSGKLLLNIVETYPRDELFEADADILAKTALEIAQLYERPRLRIIARPDRLGRFVSVLAFLPRDRYDSRKGQRVGELLAQIFGGRLAATYPFFPDGPLVRVHYVVGRNGGALPTPAAAEVEAAVRAVLRTWDDALAEALRAAYGSDAPLFVERYSGTFSAAYMEAFGATTAVEDIAVLGRLSAAAPLALTLYRPAGEPPPRVDLKLYSRGRALPLSERVPLLDEMGFRVVSERTFHIGAHGDGVPSEMLVWLHDMALERRSGEAIDLAALRAPLEAALMALFTGAAESDALNGLVLAAEIGWRQIALLRSLSRYLRQIGIGYSSTYLALAIVHNPAVARLLIALFYARFDPAQSGSLEERAAVENSIDGAIDTALGAVASLDEDRILRRFRNLVRAGVRTNYFQTGSDGRARATIALKLSSHKIDDLPLPRPLYEIAVYAPRVEAIHMRFGKVARGGIRWSDRPQDFRTEILALAKAQQVKNAVIVPVGAKGGFVPKGLPPASEREAWLAEGRAAYRTFIGALLDLTDNLEGARVVPPASTIRHDDDDPYLVVAADKGTASFSDVANALALERGFWLGDAFASGGSAGYDHKKMGITARGAFEAIMRHFREMNVDIAVSPISVAGIGDMSGDVFGNGMLLTKTLRLVAAFDHRDIFIDPSPDPATSFAERARLFALPRSSWQDYDRGRLSPGGGIYSRQAKEIALSAQARALLGTAQEKLTPPELMRAILMLRVDLLWFGGIGTFVRASSETDEAAADRANDSIRVSAAALNCRVIGEGANLAMTQLARIEAAERGIRVDTDAIDNSAGVNTSDVEVNIKIALAQPLRDGKLDARQRETLLAAMTDDVAAGVIANNASQSLALSLAERRGVADLPFVMRLIQLLERQGRLDRALEFLPSDAAMLNRARAGRGLTRPELAVLLAYAKLAAEHELLLGPVPDEDFFAAELLRYFPPQMRERFPDAIRAHPLRREIIATALANTLIDRGGPTLLARVGDETGADTTQIVRAFTLARAAYGLDELERSVAALDDKIGGDVQLALYAALQSLMISRLVWFARNVDFSAGLAVLNERFSSGVRSLLAIIDTIVPEASRAALSGREAALRTAGVPDVLARRLAASSELASAPDIVVVAEELQRPLAFVASAFFATDELFEIGKLADAGRQVAVADYYDRLALDRALDQVERARRRITAEILRAAPAESATGNAAVQLWLTGRGADSGRIRAAVAEIVGSGLTVSRVSVAASLLDDLAKG